MDNMALSNNETEDTSDEAFESLELKYRLTFDTWKEFKTWIYRFASEKGFNCKIRTSKTNQGVMRRATYECIKSSSQVSQVTSDLNK